MAFNAKGLLDNLLASGQKMLRERDDTRHRQGHSQSSSAGRSPGAGDLGSLLSGFGGGAAGGTALSLLLGSKRMRKKRGGLMSHGGASLLGALAHKAYTEWQAQARANDTSSARTLDRVSDEEADAQSNAVLVALVGAAKADGHVDDRERALIEEEFRKIDGSPQVERWLDEQLRKPVDPAQIAAEADSPEVAAEMYLASRLVVDTENYMERAYLDELARCLELDPDLRSRLDGEAQSAVTS